jgi:hypothetical protein
MFKGVIFEARDLFLAKCPALILIPALFFLIAFVLPLFILPGIHLFFLFFMMFPLCLATSFFILDSSEMRLRSLFGPAFAAALLKFPKMAVSLFMLAIALYAPLLMPSIYMAFTRYNEYPSSAVLLYVLWFFAVFLIFYTGTRCLPIPSLAFKSDWKGVNKIILSGFTLTKGHFPPLAGVMALLLAVCAGTWVFLMHTVLPLLLLVPLGILKFEPLSAGICLIVFPLAVGIIVSSVATASHCVLKRLEGIAAPQD